VKAADREAVERAAQVLFRQGWVEDGSAFSLGIPIWTSAHLDELNRSDIGRVRLPDSSFLDNLEVQLAAASDGARQLVAELLYLQVLPLVNIKGDTKAELLTSVLEWTASPADLPADVRDALDIGVFNGGIGFNSGRWKHLAVLIQLVRAFKTNPPAERTRLLGDPWAFRDFVRGVDTLREPGLRNAVLYLAFPRTFPPVVATDDRRRIVAAFKAELGTSTGDADRDLVAVRDALAEQSHGYVDFYAAPWDSRWRVPRETVADTNPGAAHGWLVRGGSVGGNDLVPTWVDQGFVSLPTRNIAVLDATITHEELRDSIDEAYSGSSYNQRQQRVTDFWAFLSRVRPGDIVASPSQGALYVGRVTGDPTWVDSAGGLSNLRREVVWGLTATEFVELPAGLAGHLKAQQDVVDLSENLADLEALLQEEPPVPVELVLTPATSALADTLLVDQAWLQESIDLLADQRQLILYGPPGTGKTYLGRALAAHLAAVGDWQLVQFHPCYSYEDFFEGLRPVVGPEGTLSFQLRPGPFRRLVDRARDRPTVPHVLVIDEINRGNLAKIFGELYFLLEYRDEPISLLYASSGDPDFSMPPNVFLIGTMNTADRSIALLDAAMRRRFAFVELSPATEPTRSVLSRWLTREGLPPDSARLLDRLNQEIADPEFAIGPSYLMRLAVHAPGGLERVWRTQILPLLAEHHYGDDVDVAQRYGLARLRQLVVRQSGAPLLEAVASTVGPDPAPDQPPDLT